MRYITYSTGPSVYDENEKTIAVPDHKITPIEVEDRIENLSYTIECVEADISALRYAMRRTATKNQKAHYARAIRLQRRQLEVMQEKLRDVLEQAGK